MTLESGRKKRSIIETDKNVPHYSQIKHVIDQYSVASTTTSVLDQTFVFIWDRPLASINFFIRYFNHVHDTQFDATGPLKNQKCGLKKLFEKLDTDREAYLKTTRLNRNLERNQMSLYQTNINCITSELSTLSPTLPTPLTLPPRGLLRSIVDKTMSLVGKNQNDNIDVGASPHLKLDTQVTLPSPLTNPSPTSEPRLKLTFTMSPHHKLLKRTSSDLYDENKVKINIHEVSQLGTDEEIAKSLSANYRIQASHFLAQRVTKLVDAINEVVNVAWFALKDEVSPLNKLIEYDAKIINVPESEYFELKTITFGQIRKFSEKAIFHRYDPLKICQDTKCAMLDGGEIYVQSGTDMRCEHAPQLYNEVMVCTQLIVENCYYQKTSSQICTFTGYLSSQDPHYNIKDSYITFFDRRIRKRPFYMTDEEITFLLDGLFPFSGKLKSFLDSLYYKGYQFSIHIILVLFLLIKLAIKLVKFIRKKFDFYHQARIDIEQKRDAEMQELRELLTQHNISPASNTQKMLKFKLDN